MATFGEPEMINSDDPRLTAYVLGELGDADRAEIESALTASPELQAEVESIRQSAAMFEDSLRIDSGPALTAEHRRAIQEQSAVGSIELVDHSTRAKGSRRRRRVITIATASVAASLLVALLFFSAVQYSTRTAWRDVSQMVAPAEKPSASQSLPSGHYLADDAVYLDSGAVRSPHPDDVEEHVEGERLLTELYGDASSADLPSESLNYRDLPQNVLEQIRKLNAANQDLNQDESSDLSFAEKSSGRTAPAMGGFDSSVAPGDNTFLNSRQPELMDSDESSPRFDVSNLETDRLRAGLGFDSGAEDRAAESSSEGRTSGRGEAMFGEPVDGVPAIRRVDPSSSTDEREQESIERGRLTGGKGLRADVSRSSVDENGVIAEDRSQKSVSDLLAMLADPNESGVLEPDAAINGDPAAIDLRSVDTERKLAERLDRMAGKKQNAPQRTWRRAQATPNASRLIVGDRDELLMEGMQANVMVDGFRARVLLDLYYFNDRSQQVEGNFKLRLPNDASLYYFAFGESAYEYRPQVDQLASKGFLNGELVRAAGLSPKGILEAREGSWSKVKEARVVPREKAAHAYSETVRRRVDPALVEWSGAGMFNARVFPLMPKKLHRIVVGYDVDLQQVGDDLVYQLDLPEDVAQCMVDLNVSALPGTSADIRPTTRPFVSGGRAYYHFNEVKDSSIELRYAGTGPVLLEGSDPQAGKFFAARVTPKLPAGEMQAGAERATFLVDTSLSSRPDKFNIWLNLLESVLTKNRETMKQFSVLFFSIDSHWWKEADVDNTPENVDALMTYCHSLSLEGATDLRQAIREATAPSWAKKDEKKSASRDLFLLSDGAVTWGEMNPHQLSKSFTAGQTLIAYKTGMAGTSTTTLEHLTRETGGAVFSIINEDEVANAATAHRSRPWKLTDVSMAGGSDLLVAGRPQYIYPGQSLLLVGRGDPDAEVLMTASRGDEQKHLSVEFERVVESDLAARAYGQVAVGQLEDLGSSLEDISVAYARHFRVTRQTCSLLMLESEADYQRFNIKPEDDLFVVRSTPSADLITQKLDELSEQLGDAKANVVAWLDKLQNTAGFQFELPTALRLAIDRLPQSAFDVEPARLSCESHKRGDFAKEFIEQLDSGKLEYDAVTAQANQLLKQHGAANGLRMLSSLIEQNPGDPVLTRDVAYSAIEWDLGGQAFPLLRRVASMRPYEPQSYIAMAQCLADIGHADLAMVYYEVAVNARWHDRYKDIRDIAGVEYLRLLRRINQGELSSHAPEYAKARFESLAGQTPINNADLVITMMWNTDRTDVDLHVLEPTGEECFYNHPTTRIGGHVTHDVTEGLGPEMYTLPKAKRGDYKIMANYFGSDANRTKVRTKVYITVYKDFGDKQELVEKKTVTLSNQKEKRDLSTVTIKN